MQMTKVIPSAMMPITDVASRMLIRLRMVRKYGDKNDVMMQSAIRTARKSSKRKECCALVSGRGRAFAASDFPQGRGGALPPPRPAEWFTTPFAGNTARTTSLLLDPLQQRFRICLQYFLVDHKHCRRLSSRAPNFFGPGCRSPSSRSHSPSSMEAGPQTRSCARL